MQSACTTRAGGRSENLRPTRFVVILPLSDSATSVYPRAVDLALIGF